MLQRPLHHILGPVLPSLSRQALRSRLFCAPKTTSSHSRPNPTISLSPGTQEPSFLCSKDHFITFSAQSYHLSLARHSGAVFSVLQRPLHHILGQILPSLSRQALRSRFLCASKTITLHSRPNSTISLARHSGVVFSVLQRLLHHILGRQALRSRFLCEPKTITLHSRPNSTISLSPGTQESFFLCSKDHYILGPILPSLPRQALRSRFLCAPTTITSHSRPNPTISLARHLGAVFSVNQRPLHHILGPILPSLSRQALRSRFLCEPKTITLHSRPILPSLSRQALRSRFLCEPKTITLHSRPNSTISLSPGTQESFFLCSKDHYILGPILPSLPRQALRSRFLCAPTTITSHSRPNSTISLSPGTQEPFSLCSNDNYITFSANSTIFLSPGTQEPFSLCSIDHYITFSAQFCHLSLARHSGAVFSVLQRPFHYLLGPILPSLSLARHSGAVFSVLQRPVHHILGPILPFLSPGTPEPFSLCSKDHYIAFSAQFYHLSLARHSGAVSSVLQRPFHHILGLISEHQFDHLSLSLSLSSL